MSSDIGMVLLAALVSPLLGYLAGREAGRAQSKTLLKTAAMIGFALLAFGAWQISVARSDGDLRIGLLVCCLGVFGVGFVGGIAGPAFAGHRHRTLIFVGGGLAAILISAGALVLAGLLLLRNLYG